MLQKKCDQYWPKEGNEIYGLIQVRLVHEEVLATYTIRKLAIRHMKVRIWIFIIVLSVGKVASTDLTVNIFIVSISYCDYCSL